MDVIIQPSEKTAVMLVARIIEKALRAKPSSVLGLATGRTMEGLYKVLVDMHKKHSLDFSLCRTFNLDEYVGLAANDPHSYRYFMDHLLFKHINIDLRNTHLPNGMSTDLDAECRHYEDLIKDVGGIDLQLLGIGKAGHIGFNEPLSALRSKTRVKALSPITIEQNAGLFGGDSERVPRRAITMGVGTIIDSKRCILLATGTEKADIVAKAVEGPITGMISATALQLHPCCTVVVDEAAAKKLKGQDYYRRIFEHEPEWEEFRKLLGDDC